MANRMEQVFDYHPRSHRAAMTFTMCNQTRIKRGLRSRRATPVLGGTNADAGYAFECALTALFACAVPKPLLRLLFDLRARWR